MASDPLLTAEESTPADGALAGAADQIRGAFPSAIVLHMGGDCAHSSSNPIDPVDDLLARIVKRLRGWVVVAATAGAATSGATYAIVSPPAGAPLVQPAPAPSCSDQAIERRLILDYLAAIVAGLSAHGIEVDEPHPPPFSKAPTND